MTSAKHYNTHKIILGALLVMFLPLPVTECEESDAVQATLKEMISFYENFEREFDPNTVTMVVHRRELPDDKGKEIKVVLKRVDEKHKLSFIETIEDHRQLVYSKNPSYQFAIHNDSSQWLVEEVEKLRSDDLRVTILDITTAEFLLPIVVNDVIKIADLITMPGVEVLNFREETIDGDVKVSFDIKLPKDRSRKDGTPIHISTVSFAFFPQKYGWIPSLMVLKFPNGGARYVTRGEYTSYKDIKIPSKSSWYSTLSDGKRDEECEISYHVDSSGNVKKQEFYLSHYGIPEPDFDGSQRILPIRYILIGLGGLLIVLAFWSMYRRHRKKNNEKK